MAVRPPRSPRCSRSKQGNSRSSFFHGNRRTWGRGALPVLTSRPPLFSSLLSPSRCLSLPVPPLLQRRRRRPTAAVAAARQGGHSGADQRRLLRLQGHKLIHLQASHQVIGKKFDGVLFVQKEVGNEG